MRAHELAPSGPKERNVDYKVKGEVTAVLVIRKSRFWMSWPKVYSTCPKRLSRGHSARRGYDAKETIQNKHVLRRVETDNVLGPVPTDIYALHG